METKKILLCCGAGMSSGFLAQKTRQAAKKEGVSVSVEARSIADIASYMSSIDVLMIGPHYGNELEKFENMASPYNVPVVVIPQVVYSQLRGDELLKLALETINDAK